MATFNEWRKDLSKMCSTGRQQEDSEQEGDQNNMEDTLSALWKMETGE
jgi:hypothetical protein